MTSIADAARAAARGATACPRFAWPYPEGTIEWADGEPMVPCAYCRAPRSEHADKGDPLPPWPQGWEGFLVRVERRDMPVLQGRVDSVGMGQEQPIGLWLTRTLGPRTGEPLYVPWMAVTGVTAAS